ncbi:MAG: hypothetical protein J0H54_01685 [Rhizobiales bacterium]|nr:hypothetical protein [Hyphomicrobiales bacterium]
MAVMIVIGMVMTARACAARPVFTACRLSGSHDRHSTRSRIVDPPGAASSAVRCRRYVISFQSRQVNSGRTGHARIAAAFLERFQTLGIS